MRGKKAKELKRQVYGDYSSKQRDYNIPLSASTLPDGTAILDKYDRPIMGRFKAVLVDDKWKGTTVKCTDKRRRLYKQLKKGL